MKERIERIMKWQNMTQRDFAEALGISPSSLSSIFNGRTSPTNNHVQAIHRRFPQVNILWLLFGEGDMLDAAEGDDTLPLFADAPAITDAEPKQGMNGGTQKGNEAAQLTLDAIGESTIPGQVVVREIVKYVDKPRRQIKEIRVFYDDGTFDTFAGKTD